MKIDKPVEALAKQQRLAAVKEMVANGIRDPRQLQAALVEQGFTHHGQPYSLSTIRRDMREVGVVAEIVGRQAMVTGLWQTHPKIQIAYDATRPSYDFWDKLRRGIAKGYELSGLFCRPITEIIAGHVLGDSIGAMLVDADSYTDTLLRRFMDQYQGLLMSLCVDLYALGDQYVVINPDGRLTVVSPDAVSFEVAEIDYRQVVKVTITTKLEKVMISDEYRADGRTLRYRYGDGRPDRVQEFENLIGRIPIVHFSNDRGINEVYGRPVYEAARRLLSRYDDLLTKALNGAELMGNPVPVFQGMENISETLKANSSDTVSYLDQHRVEQQRPLIDMDILPAVVVGKGGSFSFASPNAGFTDDIRNMLKSLFLLILDHTRIPEFVWGGAIASSKASAETQMPPFLQYINGKRHELEGTRADATLGVEATGGLVELLSIWLQTRALIDPQIKVRPVRIDWSELDSRDETLRFQWAQYLNQQGYLGGHQLLELSRFVKDPVQTLETAKTEQRQQMQSDATVEQI